MSRKRLTAGIFAVGIFAIAVIYASRNYPSDPVVSAGNCGTSTRVSVSANSQLLRLTNTTSVFHSAPAGEWRPVQCSQLTFDIPAGKSWNVAFLTSGEFSCYKGQCSVQSGLRGSGKLTADCTEYCGVQAIVPDDGWHYVELPARVPGKSPWSRVHQEYALTCSGPEKCTVTMEITARIGIGATHLRMDDLTIQSVLTLK